MIMERVLETCSVISHTRHDFFLKWYGSAKNTEPMKIICQLQMKYSIKLWHQSSSCKDRCRALPCAACPCGSQVCLLILCLSIISLIPVQKCHSTKNHVFTILCTCLKTSMLGANLFLKCFWHHFLAQGREEIFLAFFHLYHFLYLPKFFKENSNPTELEENSIDKSLHHPSCFLHRQPSSFPKPHTYSFLLCLTLHP